VTICYQADADLNQAIVTGVLGREPTIDFQTAFAAGLEGVKDPEVLAIAAEQGRILISHDRRTMPLEFATFITSSQSSGVIIVSRKLSIEVVIEELLLVWAASSAEEWVNRIAKLPL
jgi:predicted nuclease of predicted toxin-antitoxin system